MGALVVALRRFDGIRIFVTGHTGFKGSWLVAMLSHLGARVVGFALPPPTTPSLFDEARLKERVDHVVGDIRDDEALQSAMARARPDAVVHLAAQSLVLEGLADPRTTYQTNVAGTVNVIEAIRATETVRASVIVTSDKCYRPGTRAMAEDDPLGGHDPYSASKACAELVVEGYRPLLESGAIVATARAGNVFGFGDWSPHRLVADLARAMLADRKLVLRHPNAIRPWQHVIDALGGYLAILYRALDGDREVARSWNFGPPATEHVTVNDVVARFQEAYGAALQIVVDDDAVAENPALVLDSELARVRLNWKPIYDLPAGIGRTARDYRRRADGEAAAAVLDGTIGDFLAGTAG